MPREPFILHSHFTTVTPRTMSETSSSNLLHLCFIRLPVCSFALQSLASACSFALPLLSTPFCLHAAKSI